jgi:hypothetical protein
MSYGVIEYDNEGKPKCEICGLSFHRVLRHVHDKHGINAREYKLEFGFDLKKGICSKESAEKTSLKAIINENLSGQGEGSRFKKGYSGRTKEQVSEHTKLALKERLHAPERQEKMKEIGRKVGNSGLGNKSRWKDKKKE